MTPLLGTKNPSVPVGDKSGGERRAARSLLSCAWWRGMERLWRGMGGDRPPHRRHGHEGFHESRHFGLSRSPAVRHFLWSERDLHHWFSRNTRYESRLLSSWARQGGATGNRRQDHCARRQVTASRFTVVRHCSLLFAIVRQKILSGATVPSPSTPATRPVRFLRITKHENTAFVLFTNHETRITDFVAVVFAVGAQGTHNQELPPGSPRTPPGRCFPARCGAAWRGYSAAWAAAAVPRAGNTACKVFTRHESRNMVFPAPPSTPGRATPTPANGFSRITKHETRTAFMPFFPQFHTISRHFPAPPPPGAGARAPSTVFPCLPGARRQPPRTRCRPQDRAWQSPCPPYVSPASIMTGANDRGGCPAHRTLITT